MNIWAKMITALRGGVNEAGEAIVDSQALRILDQEVRDAAEEMKRSKDSLAEIMARHKLADEKCNQIKREIAEHEGYAGKALEKSDEKLALEIAERIAELENKLATENDVASEYRQYIEKLRAAINTAEKNIKRLKQQVDTIKATEQVQKAQSAVAERHSGSNSKLITALESLERIKERQALKDAQIKAAGEIAETMTGDSLKSKLEASGIFTGGSSAEGVLNRLKVKQNNAKTG